jgi:predicted MFS family arabinose efflux permease
MTEIQAGYLFSIEMAGYAFSSALVFTIVTRVNWRHILLAGVIIAVVTNIISIYIHGYTELLKIRFLAGLGAGFLMNVTILSIGLTRHIDRNYGFWTMTQLVIGALGLFLLPNLILKFGLAAPFATVTMLALLILPLVKRFPGRGKSSNGTTIKTNKLWLGLSALCGILIYYSGQAAVWAYIERIGIDAEIPLKSVGSILSLSLVVAIFGAALATWLGSRRGRRLPIAASMICSAIGISLLWESPSIYPYALAACLFNAAWYFCLPYLTAVIANIDSNGRLLIGVGVVFPASLAAGPALATYLLTGASYSPVLWTGMLSLPVGLLIMWKAAGSRET